MVIPPDYNVSIITAPMKLYYSPLDVFTNTTDVNRLLSKLTNDYEVKVLDQSKFNHIDFMWGKNAPTLVYQDIIAYFNSKSPSYPVP